MADTTEAVERLRAHLDAAERQGFSVVNRVYSARGLSVKDATDAADTIQALLERVERAERERDEARAGMAYVLDHAVYGDSYGVHGSDFEACRFCMGGGAPGVELVHEPNCPVGRYPQVVEEWFGEMREAEEIAQAAETKLATLTEALGHVLPWAEIGRFLWEERSICYGDGRTQPHERAIEWGWQQSTPSCSDWKAMRSDVDAWLSSFGEDGGNINDAPFSDARQALATINYLTAEEE